MAISVWASQVNYNGALHVKRWVLSPASLSGGSQAWYGCLVRGSKKRRGSAAFSASHLVLISIESVYTQPKSGTEHSNLVRLPPGKNKIKIKHQACLPKHVQRPGLSVIAWEEKRACIMLWTCFSITQFVKLAKHLRLYHFSFFCFEARLNHTSSYIFALTLI